MKSRLLSYPWWIMAPIYGALYGLGLGLLDSPRPPATAFNHGLIAGVIFAVLIAPWLRRRRNKAKKAATSLPKSDSAIA